MYRQCTIYHLFKIIKFAIVTLYSFCFESLVSVVELTDQSLSVSEHERDRVCEEIDTSVFPYITSLLIKGTGLCDHPEKTLTSVCEIKPWAEDHRKLSFSSLSSMVNNSVIHTASLKACLASGVATPHRQPGVWPRPRQTASQRRISISRRAPSVRLTPSPVERSQADSRHYILPVQWIQSKTTCLTDVPSTRFRK